MPQIVPIRDLKDTAAISALCHESEEPVFITKNGQGDLAVMSIAQYDRMLEKINLYSKLAEGLNDAQSGRVQSFDSAMAEIRKDLAI